jgi:5-bromo-4-chloroindolyl phosphate hydrolysis protein
MSNTNKINVSEIYELFETISNKLDKQTNPSIEPTQIDLSAVNATIERFENVIKEVRKPTKVEHQHRHTIDIGSSKVFLSMVVMVLVILGLSYAIGEQRRSISQYKDNDLKYRYIKMNGQMNEENLYRLEQQFKYNDSIKIIRKQVETYEELVKEQAERLERAKWNRVKK